MLRDIYSLIEPDDQKKCLLMTFVVLCISLLNFMGLASIFPVLQIVLEGKNLTNNAILVMTGVLFFIILKNAVVFMLQRILTKFLLGQYRHFSYQLFCHYYHQGLLFIREKGVNHLAKDVNSLCLTFSVSVLQSLFTIAGEGLLTVLVMTTLFIIAPLAAVFLLTACIPFVCFYIFVVRKRVRIYGKEDLLARRKQARTVFETFRGYAELEINDAFNVQLEQFTNELDIINHNRLRMGMIHAFPGLLCEVAVILGLCVLLFIQGGNQVLIGSVFAVAAFRLMPSVKNMLNSWTSLQQASYCVETLHQELNKKEEKQDSDECLSFKSELKADHLTFAYPNEEPTINDFSCTIKKGECIGIQGTSGAGKTTLFNVLLGFYPLQSGQIFIDREKLTETNIKAWHKIVGYVPQNVFIMQASIAENIALGDKNIDKDKVWNVLQQVQLEEWVKSLPDGIYTQLGEMGGRLSGGQRQRIGIARALYKQAEILFFDEATSALDNATEREINQTLRSLSESQKGLTMLIIAHRDTSLTFCNKIVTLN